MTIKAQNIVFHWTGGTEDRSVSLQDFLDGVNVHLRAYYAESFPSLAPSQLEIDDKVGSKYIRVWSNSRGSRSAYCFIDYQGRIYKPATWKAPAKHARGSIFDPNFSWGRGLGPHGATYLR